MATSYWVEPHLVALFVGYDPAADYRTLRQYRSVIASLMNEARAAGRPLFLSTGAASFKLNRGGVASLELEAVYVRHLPRHRKLPWWVVQKIYARAFDHLDMELI